MELLLEMARIGYFMNEYEVLVWTDDQGKIPHFHIRDRSTKGEKFSTCIKIEKPEYFIHSGKSDKLNSKEKKNLILFLQSKSKIGSIEITNWDKIIMYWKDNNSDVILPSNLIMPDYTLL